MQIKFKDIVYSYADSKNLDKDKMYTLISAVWKELNDEMNAIDHMYVKVSGLGTFHLKYWGVDDRIKNIEKAHSKRPTEFTYRLRNNLYKMKQLVQEDKLQRDQHKLKRKSWNNESERQDPEDMG